MKTPHRIRLMNLALALALASSACGRSPIVRHYTLLAVAPHDAESAFPDPAPIAVRVGPVDLPRLIERPEIVRRTGRNEVAFDSFHRWASDLESEIARAIGENLGRLLASDRIVVYPHDPTFPIAYRVAIEIQELLVAPTGEVDLRARWTVSQKRGEPPVAIETSAVRDQVLRSPVDHEQAVSMAAPDIVDAYARAVGSLSEKIAARLQQLEKDRREAETALVPGGEG